MITNGPPCPLLFGPGANPIPMHVVRMLGPMLVAANDPVCLFVPEVQHLSLTPVDAVVLFSAGVDPMGWKPDPDAGWLS